MMTTSPNPSRRLALKLAATSLATPTLLAYGANKIPTTINIPDSIKQAITHFAALAPDTSNCLVQVDHPTTPWHMAHHPNRQLFVGSAIKTFILAQFLRDVETKRDGLTEDLPADINDTWRSPGSAVFENLTGTTAYRHILEAMISHSDNTATDIVLAKVGPDRVRALIAQAGLKNTHIPHSTRRLFSYLAGANAGVDLGWKDITQLSNGDTLNLTNRTDMINEKETMVSSATEMVSWYKQSLSGKFFQKPDTLVEYKRIQSMANALSKIVPSDTLAFGKGGSIDWLDFHCLCVPGQMLVDHVPVTFCFTLNWHSDKDTSISRLDEFIATTAAVLSEAAKAIRA